MRLLTIDPFSGVSGDMLLGALFDLGINRDPVIKLMSSVGAEPEVTRVLKCGISALQVHTNTGPSHRTLEEVLSIVRSSDAPKEVIDRAVLVFEMIAQAEEQVHGKKTHFHEVGADDAIADVLGVTMAFHLLKADNVVTMPVNVGNGTVKMAHGIYPVPAPATINIICSGNIPVRETFDINTGELATPTGTALLAVHVITTDKPVCGKILKVGYGSGIKDFEDHPNVLRMVLYEISDKNGFSFSEEVDILETNVDDVTGEVIGHLLNTVIENGARDASAIPIMMKKGRPGHLIKVIALPADSRRIASLMAMELGTLGIRCIPSVHRFIADRSVEDVDAEILGRHFSVPVKFGSSSKRCYSIKTEFDKAVKVSEETGVPVREVLKIFERIATMNRDEV